MVPRADRDPLPRRLLRRPKQPIACTDCGCLHVFHAFSPGPHADLALAGGRTV